MYVVSSDCMSRAIAALMHLAKQSSLYQYMGGVSVREKPSELGRALYSLNVRAVNTRYKHVKERVPAYRFSIEATGTLVTNYKALCCLRYQCLEGEKIESEPLFQEMDKAVGLIARRIVEDLPAFQAAPWG